MKFRNIALLLGLLSLASTANAQFERAERNDSDTLTVEDDPCIFPDDHRFCFTLDPITGVERIGTVDTTHIGLAAREVMEDQALAITHTGNLMGPHLVMNYFQRKKDHDFMFMNAYQLFASHPEEIRLFNTRLPFTNAAYITSGSGNQSNDHLNLDFAGNFNKNVGLGTSLNYLYARGIYPYESAKPLKWDTYFYYKGDHYKAYVTFDLAKYGNQENGGISNDSLVLYPDNYEDNFTEAANMQTRLINTWNDTDYSNLHLSHSWNFGEFHIGSFRAERNSEATPAFYDSLSLYRDSLKLAQDSTGRTKLDSTAMAQAPRKKAPAQTTEEEEEDVPFIPVATAFHSVDLQWIKHTFRMNDGAYPSTTDPSAYYAHNYIDDSKTLDTTSYFNFSTYAGLRINEGFAKWSQMALSAFVGYDRQTYTMMQDTMPSTFIERKHVSNTVWVGGQISRHQNSALTFDITGRFAVSGDKAGDVDINGEIGTVIPFGRRDEKGRRRDSLIISAKGMFRNLHTSYLWNHYYSNHFKWNNDFNPEQHLRLEGTISYPRSKTQISAGFEHINKYHYFSAKDGLPHEYDKQLDIFGLTIRQEFQVGILHWDNALAFQTSTDEDVLALPKFSIETDLNIRFRIAKTLYTQLGAQGYYYTRYYAPQYEPATQTFQAQSSIKCGGYPLLNVYANFNLKRIKFFVQMTNLLGKSVTNDTFSNPHYPIQPMRFMYGMVFNFQD